jgi:hypothetical protein
VAVAEIDIKASQLTIYHAMVDGHFRLVMGGNISRRSGMQLCAGQSGMQQCAARRGSGAPMARLPHRYSAAPERQSPPEAHRCVGFQAVGGWPISFPVQKFRVPQRI